MKPCMRAGAGPRAPAVGPAPARRGRAGADPQVGAGPCTLVVRDHGIYQRRSRRIG